VVTLTPVTAATAEDPYAYYARLAVEHPFFYDDELRCWVACSVKAVDAVLGNDDFHVRPAIEPVPSIIQGTPLGELFSRMVRMTDGPAHAPRRRDAEALISAMNVGTIASALPDLDRDALEKLMFAFPSRAVATLLGIAAPRVPGIEEFAHALARAIAPSATAEDVPRASSAVVALDKIFTERFPGVQERAGAIGLLFQTYDGTAGLIGNTLHQLAVAQPAITRRIVADAQTLTGFIAEVARLDPPVHNTRRFAAHDISVEDAVVRNGESVLVLLAAANYDTEAAGRTFTFGEGAHACIAARLAITIASVAVHALVETGLDLSRITRSGFYRAPNVRVPRLALGN
jgi:cytochrome P450